MECVLLIALPELLLHGFGLGRKCPWRNVTTRLALTDKQWQSPVQDLLAIRGSTLLADYMTPSHYTVTLFELSLFVFLLRLWCFPAIVFPPVTTAQTGHNWLGSSFLSNLLVIGCQQEINPAPNSTQKMYFYISVWSKQTKCYLPTGRNNTWLIVPPCFQSLC